MGVIPPENDVDADLVERLDPSLHYIGSYRDKSVLLTEEGVLKVYRDMDEPRILEDLRHVPGIPRLLRTYKHAFLREHIDGEEFDFPSDDPIFDDVWALACCMQQSGWLLPKDTRYDQFVVREGVPHLIDVAECLLYTSSKFDLEYNSKKMDDLRADMVRKHPPKGYFHSVLVSLGLGG